MKLLVDNVWTYIEGNFKAFIIDQVTSYKVHGRWFAKSWKKGHWSGIKKFREFDRKRGQYRFPTGFLEQVTAVLDRRSVRYELHDSRIFESFDPIYELDAPELPGGKLYLRDYQREALEKMLLYGRGVVKLPTASGKTEVAAAAIKSIGRPSLFLTHRKTLLHQTQRRLETRLSCPIGIVGDGAYEPKRITVAMIQTISKHLEEDWLRDVEVICGDEIHHLEADQWYKTFSAINAPFRFGLTATPCTDGPGMRIVGMTGDVIATVSIQDLISAGVLAQPRIWFVKVTDPDIPKSTNYQSVYARGITSNMTRNLLIVQVAQTFAEEGKSCLTLVRRLKHGRLLLEMLHYKEIPTAFIHGKVEESDRVCLLDDLWAGRLKHIVAMDSVMGEGVDLPDLRAIINATGTRGGGSADNEVDHEIGRGTIQILGRGLRMAPGKTHLDAVDFSDQTHPFLLGASRDRLRTLVAEGYADGDVIRFWNRYERAVNV